MVIELKHDYKAYFVRSLRSLRRRIGLCFPPGTRIMIIIPHPNLAASHTDAGPSCNYLFSKMKTWVLGTYLIWIYLVLAIFFIMGPLNMGFNFVSLVITLWIWISLIYSGPSWTIDMGLIFVSCVTALQTCTCVLILCYFS